MLFCNNDALVLHSCMRNCILKPRLRDTTCCETGCQIGCTTGLTTGCIVETGYYGYLRADCLYTWISSGPNARYRVCDSLYLLLYSAAEIRKFATYDSEKDNSDDCCYSQFDDDAKDWRHVRRFSKIARQSAGMRSTLRLLTTRQHCRQITLALYSKVVVVVVVVVSS